MPMIASEDYRSAARRLVTIPPPTGQRRDVVRWQGGPDEDVG